MSRKASIYVLPENAFSPDQKKQLKIKCRGACSDSPTCQCLKIPAEPTDSTKIYKRALNVNAGTNNVAMTPCLMIKVTSSLKISPSKAANILSRSDNGTSWIIPQATFGLMPLRDCLHGFHNSVIMRKQGQKNRDQFDLKGSQTNNNKPKRLLRLTVLVVIECLETKANFVVKYTLSGSITRPYDGFSKEIIKTNNSINRSNAPSFFKACERVSSFRATLSPCLRQEILFVGFVRRLPQKKLTSFNLGASGSSALFCPSTW